MIKTTTSLVYYMKTYQNSAPLNMLKREMARERKCCKNNGADLFVAMN